MDINQRQKWIIDALNEQKSIRIADICKELDVSRETIRKDIYTLSQQGLVQAIRGGATLPSSVKETKYEQRKRLNLNEKKDIAKNAIRFIRNGDSVFLDYGTSAVEIAEEIRNSSLQDLTIITNSTNVVETLQYEPEVQIILLGGTLRPSEGSVSGPLTLANITNIYCDVGFFGCGGINLSAGVTNHYVNEVEVSKKMMEHCRIKVVLADHSKFERTALYKTADVQDIDVIITDSEISNKVTKEMRLANVSFINGKTA